ncbi:heparanase-like protein 2 isoform X2 [Wolffia australiana]
MVRERKGMCFKGKWSTCCFQGFRCLQSLNMGCWLLLLIFFHTLPLTFSEESQLVDISVNGSSLVAETDDNYICATLDWWPPEKCNYNQCPWGMASVFNLDLGNAHLRKAIQAFNTVRIRIGGSLQDHLFYDEPGLGAPCRPFRKQAGGMFGFSKGCLTRKRWDQLNLFFKETSAIVTFGLNALNGRRQTHDGTWVGPWNSSNARAFMEYTLSKGYAVDSWEFGNELSGSGVGARVKANVYGKDMIELKKIVKDLYRKSSPKPLILAPGGFYEHQWYMDFLHASGPGVVDVVSHHIYNLGADLRTLTCQHGPWASSWISESGGAYNSGARLVSDTFLDSFWYLDQLGLAAKYNTKTYCRQSLIGGNYGLLDLKTFAPNPDYYGALLWHRLMGKGVLEINKTGSPFLRAYAHCAKNRAGVSMLLINLSNNTNFIVSVTGDNPSDEEIVLDGGVRESALINSLKIAVAWVGKKAGEERDEREEYHLKGRDGRVKSKKLLLNGVPLEITGRGDLPALDPAMVPSKSPIRVSPLSIVFAVFPDLLPKGCS